MKKTFYYFKICDVYVQKENKNLMELQEIIMKLLKFIKIIVADIFCKVYEILIPEGSFNSHF